MRITVSTKTGLNYCQKTVVQPRFASTGSFFARWFGKSNQEINHGRPSQRPFLYYFCIA
jgi:hypothetical protein